MPVAFNPARKMNQEQLALALQDSRSQLLAHLACFEQALQTQDLRIPYCPECNLPLWEAGHVAWFQEFWIARNPQKQLGHRANPDCERSASLLNGSDSFYNSSQVGHLQRWQLDLPSLQRTQAYLAETQEETLRLLGKAGPADDDLYFHRLCLFHEDMHTEAARYMANALGIALQPESERLWMALSADNQTGLVRLQIAASKLTLGCASEQAQGFHFDNELGLANHALAAFEIDARPINHDEFLAFVEAGGYQNPHHWSAAGWKFLEEKKLQHPRFLRKHSGQWERRWFGEWRKVLGHQPITQVSRYEAQAYCRWADRRLPTEAEWVCAQQAEHQTGEPAFQWGQVWEWTNDAFAPFAGFTAHPYRDYSQPWFDGRPVLKGASVATPLRLHCPAFRNYYPADRNDIFSGFRTCSIF